MRVAKEKADRECSQQGLEKSFSVEGGKEGGIKGKKVSRHKHWKLYELEVWKKGRGEEGRI